MGGRIGILGGSGLYDLAGLTAIEQRTVSTPFGEPSDAVTLGRIEGADVAFLARHGRGHRFLPTEVNYRANLYALKALGCDAVLAVSAVGSMREEVRPGDLVLPDQFIDRTTRRETTYFGGGVAAHVSYADPVCASLRATLYGAASTLGGVTCHLGGTYLCIEGPQFSTRAESMVYRSYGVSVIGMTNATEAKLAREAELCYQTIALATDYDCWHQSETPVHVEEVVKTMRANVDKAKRLLAAAIPRIAATPRPCGCRTALNGAIMTADDAIPKAARERLGLLLARARG